MEQISFDRSHKDSRIRTIIDLLRGLSNSDSQEVKSILLSVEELRHYLSVSEEQARGNELRINAVLETLLRFTVLDFSQKLEVGELGDDLDAIAVGINTLAEELEEKIKIETDNSERLLEQNVKLERMNKELSSFAYVSSHDLQEPLRKINTYISRIIDDDDKPAVPEQIRFYLERIHSSATRMQNLIKDILEYSKLNDPHAEVTRVDLNVLAAEAKEDFEEVLKELKGTFTFADLCEIKFVPFQFKRLLNNLLSNSIKFRDPNRPPAIHLSCGISHDIHLREPKLKAGSYFHVTYTDNGIGFEPVYNEKVFEVFQRLHNDSEYPGTGVGLAICKKMVENHGGTMLANGQPGKGVTFDIYFPV